MQWGYNINKQRINAEQTPKLNTGLQWSEKKNKKNKTGKLTSSGELEHAA